MNDRLKLILRWASVIVPLVSLIFFVPWGVVRVWLSPLPDTVREQVEDAVDYGLDGIIVYVGQAGKPPALYTAGWNNREEQSPADPKLLFKIASITKLYVAAAATKLIHDKRLSLEDTLLEHFPELEGRIEYADQITLRQMLQHRSGIPSFTNNPDYPWAAPPKATRDTLEYALDRPAGFEPGVRKAYSNTNYLLLSEAIDQVLGYSHQQFIREEILVPLGLTQTFGSFRDVDPDAVMSGYYHGWDADVKGNDYGLMLATVDDVGVFLRALNDGSLFNAEEQEIYSSVYVYAHTGRLPGYSSIARYHPDLDAVVVQFVNTSGGDTWTKTEMIYRRILRILHKQETSKPLP